MGVLRFFLALILILPGLGAAITPARAQDKLGSRALIIGDSHIVGAVGGPLVERLRERGINASSYALSNSNPVHWYNSQAPRPLPGGHATRIQGLSEVRYVGTKQFPSYSELVQRHDPDIFIFEFGDNFADYGTADPERVQPSSSSARAQFAKTNHDSPVEQVRKMIAAAKQSPRFRADRCFWVTPPPKRNGFGERRLAELAGWIREGLGKDCRLIETTSLPGMNSKSLAYIEDGMHLAHPSGPPWADGILSEMQKAVVVASPPAAAAPPLQVPGKPIPFPKPRTRPLEPVTAPSNHTFGG